jgi:hypothetical protein
MSDIYCGIGNIPAGKRRGTAKECLNASQVRYYGLEQIAKELLEQGNNTIEKQQKKVKILFATLTGINKALSREQGYKKKDEKKIDKIKAKAKKTISEYKTEKEKLDKLEKEEQKEEVKLIKAEDKEIKEEKKEIKQEKRNLKKDINKFLKKAKNAKNKGMDIDIRFEQSKANLQEKLDKYMEAKKELADKIDEVKEMKEEKEMKEVKENGYFLPDDIRTGAKKYSFFANLNDKIIFLSSSNDEEEALYEAEKAMRDDWDEYDKNKCDIVAIELEKIPEADLEANEKSKIKTIGGPIVANVYFNSFSFDMGKKVDISGSCKGENRQVKVYFERRYSIEPEEGYKYIENLFGLVDFEYVIKNEDLKKIACNAINRKYDTKLFAINMYDRYQGCDKKKQKITKPKEEPKKEEPKKEKPKKEKPKKEKPKKKKPTREYIINKDGSFKYDPDDLPSTGNIDIDELLSFIASQVDITKDFEKEWVEFGDAIADELEERGKEDEENILYDMLMNLEEGPNGIIGYINDYVNKVKKKFGNKKDKQKKDKKKKHIKNVLIAFSYIGMDKWRVIIYDKQKRMEDLKELPFNELAGMVDMYQIENLPNEGNKEERKEIKEELKKEIMKRVDKKFSYDTVKYISWNETEFGNKKDKQKKDKKKKHIKNVLVEIKNVDNNEYRVVIVDEQKRKEDFKKNPFMQLAGTVEMYDIKFDGNKKDLEKEVMKRLDKKFSYDKIGFLKGEESFF